MKVVWKNTNGIQRKWVGTPGVTKGLPQRVDLALQIWMTTVGAAPQPDRGAGVIEWGIRSRVVRALEILAIDLGACPT